MSQNFLSIYAKSFNWAGFFLPKKTYEQCSDLYDFCRTLDDLAESLKSIISDLQQEDIVLEDYPKNLPVGRPNELIPAKFLTVNWGDFELLEITE